LNLLQNNRPLLALAYAGASVLVCLTAVYVGERCGQLMLP